MVAAECETDVHPNAVVSRYAYAPRKSINAQAANQTTSPDGAKASDSTDMFCKTIRMRRCLGDTAVRLPDALPALAPHSGLNMVAYARATTLRT
eukprot:13291696-Heterocapsa_arctica.AAC.1